MDSAARPLYPSTTLRAVPLPLQGRMFGPAVQRVFRNRFGCPDRVLQTPLSRDPQHAYSLVLQPKRPHPIMLGPIAGVVRMPLDLDRQPRLGTEEIEHILTCRMLSPELQAFRPQFQLPPQQNLGQRHRLPQSRWQVRGRRAAWW